MAAEFGYAGKILKVDLSSASMSDIPTSDYADRFIGGRGIAAKIYWDEVPREAKAFDPENRLIFNTGPLSGYPGISGSRTQICGKAPFTDSGQFYWGNMGGSWGAHLKFAGYDGVIVHGKSEKPVYILIQDGTAEVRDASALWGKGAIETRDLLKGELGKSARVLATGPAGENMVIFATTLADEDSATQGMAAIMGSKKLKAVVVVGKGSRLPAANPEKLAELVKYLKGVGYGNAPWAGPRNRSFFVDKKQICYGCVKGCDRAILETADGLKAKIVCAAAGVYVAAKSYYQEEKEKQEMPFLAVRLCHNYGLDTRTVVPMMRWLVDSYKAGYLTEETTGLPLSQFGSWEFFETLVKKISLREGFGDVLAQGLPQAIDSVGGKAKELVPVYLDKKGQSMGFDPRLYSTTGLFSATQARIGRIVTEIATPVGWWARWFKGDEGAGAYLSYDMLREIGKRFWGSELTFDFSTYEGKAIAVKRIQDKLYATECLILCSFFYPLRYCDYTETHEGDPAIESAVYSAVTGNETDEEGLNKIGERVFNLERAILAREDPAGKKVDEIPEWCYTVPIESDRSVPGLLIPGKDGEQITRKGNVVDREKFAQLLGEYYELRGWDKSGLQTKQKMAELDLADIAQDLAKRGLIAETATSGVEYSLEATKL